jgi:two-component system alkaline phosphatase synthesis response regulator PhoP
MARRVLVIDDEPRILDIVKYFLEQAGHEVEAFARPDEGVEAARKNRFDVAVLDLVLGDRASGYDVAGRLKKLKTSENMPVLFMSSKVEMAGLFLENFDGRAEFVLKPFRKETLLAKVDALLEGGGRQARRAAAPGKG